MARKSDQPAGLLDADNTEGLLAGLFAEENEFDRRALWRIGSWGVVTIGAVVLAVYSNQSALGFRREQIAADDFARQAQQIRQLARDSQVETRKLASAVDTLNGDRDRLYSRVTVLEQGLDSVTGAIAKQSAAASKPVVAPDAQASQQNPPAQPAPAVGPVATAPAASAPLAAPAEKRAETAKGEPQVAVTSTVSAPAPPATSQPLAAPAVTKSMMGPPDPAAPKLIEPPKPPAAVAAPAASAAPATSPKPETLAAIPAVEANDEAAEEPKTAVQRTEFAVDLGSANSVGGLRALWSGVVASNAALKALIPIVKVRESKTGRGMQLRLAAGPLQDAATAAKICAALVTVKRGCETTVFDGQRLTMASGEAQPQPGAESEPPALRPASGKRSWLKHGKDESTPKEDAKSTISSWFSSKKP